jgi:hypothetical protein
VQSPDKFVLFSDEDEEDDGKTLHEIMFPGGIEGRGGDSKVRLRSVEAQPR